MKLQVAIPSGSSIYIETISLPVDNKIRNDSHRYIHPINKILDYGICIKHDHRELLVELFYLFVFYIEILTKMSNFVKF
jgi:hypothetical protein